MTWNWITFQASSKVVALLNCNLLQLHLARQMKKKKMLIPGASTFTEETLKSLWAPFTLKGRVNHRQTFPQTEKLLRVRIRGNGDPSTDPGIQVFSCPRALSHHPEEWPELYKPLYTSPGREVISACNISVQSVVIFIKPYPTHSKFEIVKPENRGSVRLSDLPEITQLSSSRTVVWR